MLGFGAVVYDLFVAQGLQAETEHLLLASPRVANQDFYRELSILTANFPVATRNRKKRL